MIICISDYLISKYKEYRVNWTLSTIKYNVENIYLDILYHIISTKNYKTIIFTGTSAGGYPSIKFASYFNAVALISNAQIYLENYGNQNNVTYGFYHLVDMIHRHGDKLIYENKNIEKIIHNANLKKIVLYNNILDKHIYYCHTIPFVNFIQTQRYEHILDLRLFEHKNKLAEEETHHSIYFPSQKKYTDILNSFLLEEKT